jgi:hypothetical protein
MEADIYRVVAKTKLTIDEKVDLVESIFGALEWGEQDDEAADIRRNLEEEIAYQEKEKSRK